MPEAKREAKQQRSQAKKEQMAQAAARLLIEEGPAAITHRRVAREAGLAPGSGNYYFPTKRELYRIAVSGAEDLRVSSALAMAAACPTGPATPEDIAARLLEIYFAPHLDADVVTRRLTPILDAGRDPELQEILRAHQPALARALNTALETMTGRALEPADLELLMQAMGASLLYAAAVGEQDQVAYAAGSVARILALLLRS